MPRCSAGSSLTLIRCARSVCFLMRKLGFAEESGEENAHTCARLQQFTFHHEYFTCRVSRCGSRVKMTGADKRALTLTKIITAAKTHITGTPVS